VYDFRGNYIKDLLAQHPNADTHRNDAMHACPDCPLGNPKPFCQVCLGAGLITTDRLDRYAYESFANAKRVSGIEPGRH
jgi:hypothetical protein